MNHYELSISTPPLEARRQWARRAAGAAAVLASPARESAEPQQPSPEDDHRIDSLDKIVPLTPGQRKALPDKLKQIDDAGAALRKFPLPDGSAEPAFTFNPVRDSGRQ